MKYMLRDYVGGEIFESNDRIAIYSIYQNAKEEYLAKYPRRITTSVTDTEMVIRWK